MLRNVTVADENYSRPITWAADEEGQDRMDQFLRFFDRYDDIFDARAAKGYGRSARDAQEANNFAVSQLAYVEQKVYEKKYVPMKFEQLLGNVISYAAGEGATTVEYEVMETFGQGRRVSNQGSDIPYSEVASSRVQIPVALGGAGYQYTTEDLRNAAFSGRPLPMKRMEAAMTMWRRHMNFVALQGEAISNFTGLFNNASVTTANRPSGAVWDAATADTIISDITAGLTNVRTQTSDTDYPTVIGMSIPNYERLAIPRSTNSDTTVLQFILKAHPGLSIVPVFELATLGAGVTRRVVFFNPIDDNMVLHLPMPLRFVAPQYQDLAIKVPGEYKYGGLNIRRPLTVYYMDGT